MQADQADTTLRAGFLLFPDLTQLDLTGPLEVIGRVPGVEPLLVAASPEPVRSDVGARLLPDVTFAECPPLELLCVPGGPGVAALLEDEPTLAFVRTRAEQARWITSVCTGALVLGAAGLLRGRRATTHWLSLPLLERLGAVVTRERVVRDGPFITGGGVTAGIDFGLVVAAELGGEETARRIALMLEYDPSPPFGGGSPGRAHPETVRALEEATRSRQAERLALVERAAARLAQRPAGGVQAGDG